MLLLVAAAMVVVVFSLFFLLWVVELLQPLHLLGIRVFRKAGRDGESKSLALEDRSPA